MSLHGRIISPGATLGVLGGGQLGRMFAIAARRLGYRVHVFCPEADSPAAPVADRTFVAPYDDLEQVRAFARSVDVVTFEFENVPSATSDACAEWVPVRPDGKVLHITQQRLREKGFLHDHGFPVTPFRAIHSQEDLETAARDLGLPGVLKTASFGYDGKGQRTIRSTAELPEAFAGLGGAEGIYEAFVDFAQEVSVVGARTLDGEFAAFPVFENVHRHHILDVTVSPARIPPALETAARELSRGILEALDVIGLLTVELFVTRDGRLIVNELAPRTHNSGHLTLDACITCQFEQQVRAVCGLPLGSTELKNPAAMANLLGDVWTHGEPRWAQALSNPRLKLHLYGKASARPGRKMGHITATADTPEAAIQAVRDARSSL
ncbi:MAG: 5-(carboxyamino)imidazole ribonucleotide synthase, partial [Proteobacteria bacterium]|nr:5-(carboxyamino)imidazole ribonucleotide synthase [Pseudomonadota bacterium]